MLKQNIRALSRNLNKVTQYYTFFDSTPQLSQFHNHLLSLHENIKQYLRQGCFPNITILTEDSSAQSLCKSANIASNSNIYNQQQLDNNSFIIREPLSVLETGAIKFPEKGRVKLGGSSRMDKNFQDLMENIRLIILYQNKIEKLINPINNQSSMADVCLQQKSFSFEGSQIQNKENEHQPFDINNVKEDILRIIEDCKNIQQVQGNFEVIQGTGQAYSNQSQSENNDKKSLLTSMLLENQVMESDLGNSPTVKKTGRKPISQSNYKVEINKRLLKQFDFENYRIEQKGKRQRKADIKGCGGQCSQCTIF